MVFASRGSGSKKNGELLFPPVKQNIAIGSDPDRQRREKSLLQLPRQGGDGSGGCGLSDNRPQYGDDSYDDLFQTGSYTSKSSRQTFGGPIREAKKKNASTNAQDENRSDRLKPSAPARTKSGFWGFGRNPGQIPIDDETTSFDMSRQAARHQLSQQSSQQKSSQQKSSQQSSKRSSTQLSSSHHSASDQQKSSRHQQQPRPPPRAPAATMKRGGGKKNGHDRTGLQKRPIGGARPQQRQHRHNHQSEDFDIEPSNRFFDDELSEAISSQRSSLPDQRRARTRTDEQFSCSYSEDHSNSSLSTRDQHQRFAPKTPPRNAGNQDSGGGGDKNRTAKNNHFMALADHGNWCDLPETPNVRSLMKSPDRKPRHLEILRKLARPADSGSSSSDCDDAGTYISNGTPLDCSELFDFSSDDDDDSVVVVVVENDEEEKESKAAETIVIAKTDDHAMIQRKVSRMSSDQLRRWDGFQDQVARLVAVAMPDADDDDVPKLMRQFSGRESDLIQTLQNILLRSPHFMQRQRERCRRPVVPKSKGIVGVRRVSTVHMDAIASIAAANVLDDAMLSVKPEFVVDERVESESASSEDDDDSRLYYSNDDDDDESSEEESSFDEDDDDLSSQYDQEDSGSSGSEEEEDEQQQTGTDYSDDNDDENDDEGEGEGPYWNGYDD